MFNLKKPKGKEKIPHYAKIFIQKEGMLTSREIYTRILKYPNYDVGLMAVNVTLELKKLPDKFKYHKPNWRAGKWDYIGD